MIKLIKIFMNGYWIKITSQRNEYIRNIENNYQMGPLSGYFDGCDTDLSYNTVDINKAYTSN